MATVTHIIRSHYDPADREKLERETGQQNSDDPWQTESSFSAQRRIRPAPSFVRATLSHDGFGVPSRTTSSPPIPNFEKEESPDQPLISTAQWYRSLRLTAASSCVDATAPPQPSNTPGPTSQGADESLKPPQERATKNDWFILKALRSEPSTKPSSPSPSLADLLVRDPPPLPSEERYVPPVWLHISPSNIGFGMLQRSGWKEGEGLGAHAARASQWDANQHSTFAGLQRDTSNTQTMCEVIDLTLSDSAASEDALEDDDAIKGSVQTRTLPQETLASMQRSLLTPLPTILKADRLGIGLKAKTEGPYKQSKKRVTHSAAALAAHIRSAEETQRKKVVFGKGKRGFAKIHKREEDRRKSMLAYLNE